MKTTRVICVDCHRISILDNAIITTCPYCNSSHIEMEVIHKPDPAWLNVIGYAKLNPEQQKIVLSTEGLNYVSAGPGTAKSTTLAVRARYIVHQRRDNLHTPLILTFTNQAVERLTASFLNLRQQDRPQVDTIHGFAYKLLNRYRDHLPEHFKHFRVMNENDSIQIFERIRSIDPAICGTLSDTELVQTIQQYKRTSSYISSLMKETVCQEPFLHCYTQCQREFGILDFDDLIRVAVYLLRTSSRVAVMIQEQCKYVLVDESQDLTDAELELLDLISARYRNLSYEKSFFKSCLL